jgi:multiple sugar transport system substrate-binding protein
MTKITRRAVVQSGTTLAGAAALLEPSLLEWTRAWAQTAPWKPEKDAQLSLLRWKYFLQAEDDGSVALIDAFTKATGVKVTISRESIDDVQPKASVAANTGVGPDLFWALYAPIPHLFPQRCLDVTDVAEYLGKKYGGWAPVATSYGAKSEGRLKNAAPQASPRSADSPGYRRQGAHRAPATLVPTDI